MLRVSIVIVNWNTAELLRSCLQSVVETTVADEVEIVVVDNGSSDDSVGMSRRLFPQVRVIENEHNAGFGRANNQAAAVCRAPYLLLLNSDACLLSGTLTTMLQLADIQPGAAAIGAQLCNPDRSFQASYAKFPGLWQQFLVLSGAGRLLLRSSFPSYGPQLAAGPQPVDWVGGACMLLRAAAFHEVGGFDPGYFMYGEEMDLCYRLRRSGWEVWYHPQAVAIHVGGGSQSSAGTRREANLYCTTVRFFRSHYGPRQAALVTGEILALTAIKGVVHGILRTVSGGRRGRPVVALREILRQLRDHGVRP